MMAAGVRLFVSFALCVWQPLAQDATCNAAGVGRFAFRDQEALRWANSENSKRAPYYIAAAKRLYEKGLRQRDGVDKSNSDPFIALYDAQHQVLGALDLDPGNAEIWREAGQVTAMIASLSEDSEPKAQEALQLLAKACELDPNNIDKVLSWVKGKVAGEDRDFVKTKKAIGKTVSKWKTGGVPTKSLAKLLPWLGEREGNEVCPIGSLPPSSDTEPIEKDLKKQVKNAVASMAVKPIFPTLITSTNVAEHFGKGFSEKLAKIAVTKFRSFSAERKKKGQTDPNDINDAFFSAQNQGWPELHKTKEYKQLQAFLKEALIEHATKTGYPLSEHDKRNSHVSSWAAIYLEDGGRHGYHVHQGSLSSCVFYAKAPPGKTPIMFMDPRGAPPTHDYEQHIGERDFEPMAPFHHNYHFFAEAGDIVCFPSWLVHRVPSHHETAERVAFPANLQANEAWDAWYRSAVLS